MIVCFYTAKSNKKTIISTNNAIASVSAKPKIAILNISSFREGFLEIPRIKALKTIPIPTPAPANPIVAIPAPTYLAACNNISHKNVTYVISKVQSSLNFSRTSSTFDTLFSQIF